MKNSEKIKAEIKNTTLGIVSKSLLYGRILTTQYPLFEINQYWGYYRVRED